MEDEYVDQAYPNQQYADEQLNYEQEYSGSEEEEASSRLHPHKQNGEFKHKHNHASAPMPNHPQTNGAARPEGSSSESEEEEEAGEEEEENEKRSRHQQREEKTQEYKNSEKKRLEKTNQLFQAEKAIVVTTGAEIAKDLHTARVFIVFVGSARDFAEKPAEFVFHEDLVKILFTKSRMTERGLVYEKVDHSNLLILKVDVEEHSSTAGFSTGLQWKSLSHLNSVVNGTRSSSTSGEGIGFQKFLHIIPGGVKNAEHIRNVFEDEKYLTAKFFKFIEHLTEDVVLARDLDYSQAGKIGIRRKSSLYEFIKMNARGYHIEEKDIQEGEHFRYYPSTNLERMLTVIFTELFSQKRARSIVNDRVTLLPLGAKGWLGVANEDFVNYKNQDPTTQAYDTPFQVTVQLSIKWMCPTNENYPDIVAEKKIDQSQRRNEFAQKVKSKR
jgi:hypothetical protein